MRVLRCWAASSMPFSSYIVTSQLSIPLQIQPHVFGFLCAVSWSQCLFYGHHYSRLKAGACLLGFLALWAGFETGSIYALRVRLTFQPVHGIILDTLGLFGRRVLIVLGSQAGERNGTTAPLQFYGYLSAFLLASALLQVTLSSTPPCNTLTVTTGRG